MDAVTTDLPLPEVKPVRRRRVWLWVAIACALLILIPVGIYIGAVIYISYGYLNPSIEKKLAATFNSEAKIGEVKTSWLRNLQIQEISVNAVDGGKPFTIESVTLDWDLSRLMRNNSIRSATINQPHLALTQNSSGNWNFSLAPTTEGAGGYDIETLNLNGGDLNIQWYNAGRLWLQDLSGSISHNPNKSFSRMFEAQGTLESAQKIALKGVIGPGASYQLHLDGGIDFDKDLPAMLGRGVEIKGQANLEIESHRESMVLDSSRGGPLTFASNLKLRNFGWNFQPGVQRGLTLDIPDRSIELKGSVPIEFDGSSVLAVKDLFIDTKGVGTLSADATLPLQPGSSLVLSKAAGTIDFEQLNNLFSPKLLEGDYDLKGKVSYSGLELKIPLDADAPRLKATGLVSSKEAKLTIKGFGTLPTCEIEGLFDWPALRNGKLKFGDIAQIGFTLNTLSPAAENYWQGVSNGTTIHDININMGNILKSDIGRRVLTGMYDANKPPPERSALPIDFEGRIGSPDLKVNIEIQPQGRTHIAVSRLTLSDVSLTRWPLPFPVPKKVFAGVVQRINADLGGKNQSVALEGEVTAPSDDRIEKELRTQFSTTISTDENGRWVPGVIKVSRLKIPVPDLDQMFSLNAATGLTGTGSIDLTKAEFDPRTGDLQGTLTLDKAALRLNLSKEMQAMIMEAGKMSPEYGPLLSIFEECPIDHLKLSNLSTVQTVQMKDGLLKISGRVEPSQIGTKLPWPIDERNMEVPAVDVDFEMNTRGAKRSGRLILNLPGNKFEILLDEVEPGVWKFTKKVAGGAGVESKLSLTATVDFKKKMVGRIVDGKVDPCTITFNDQKLPRLAALLAQAGLKLPSGFALSGDVKDVKIEIHPFSYDPAAPREIPRGRISGRLHAAGVDMPRHQFANLTGDFECNVAVEGPTVTASAHVALTAYEALLHNGFFLIPPALKGRDAILALDAKVLRNADGGTSVNLNQLKFNLGGYAEVAAAGSATALPDGTIEQLSLKQLQLRIPDMAETRKVFGPPNLDNRAPWFGDVAVSGESNFNGQLFWLPGNRVGLSGKVGLKNAGVTLGRSNPLVLREMNGELPLIILNGAPPPEFTSTISSEVKIGSTAWSLISGKNQTLTFTAAPNQISMRSPVDLLIPAGRVRIEKFSATKLLGNDEEREIALTLTPMLDVNALLKARDYALNGIDDCALVPQPLECRLQRKTDALGASWHLQTTGNMRAPFFGGEIKVDRIKARGLFSPAPVFGCDLIIRDDEGIRVTQFTEKNPQLKIGGRPLGKFSIRANMAATGITAASFDLAGLQTFTLDVDSVDYKDNDFYYDGRFALAVGYNRVRQAFPKWFASDKDIAEYTFGVREVGLQLELKDGYLYGPRPKLANNLIVKAYGVEKGIAVFFSDRFKQDLAGDSSAKMPWSDVLKAMKPE